MREGAQKRLAGAVVLVTLAVIFVPMLFEDRSPAPPPLPTQLPPSPEFTPPQTVRPYVLNQGDGPAFSGEEGDLRPIEEVQAVSASGLEPVSPALLEPLQEPVPPSQQPATAAPRPTAQAAPQRPAVSPATKPTAQPAPAKPVPAPSAKSGSAPVAKPEAKQESTVALPEPPKSRASGMPAWVIQVSSVNSPEAAGKLADKLKQSGFSAFVERAEVGGKTYYRVRVGPDSDRNNAERTAAQLREQHRLDTLIQRYP